MGVADAVILFGHGARDPEWAGPMRRTRERILAEAPGLRVELAFLEFMEPRLDELLDRLAADGAREVSVVPMFLAQGGHLKRDLPALIAAAGARHPDMRIMLGAAVGEDEGVVAAMAARALAGARGG
ncbi:cobalamin biosynthesis protein CbiX [Pseudothauera nasutitermitis]|uniref:Cobalamin biosynthesis protein CbiX n=1 Tax=Pseudothauera nasutitermitis TaxID=2565930 RepID=A0A4S4AV30_9RHOO|nr:CbiX/SirB N-terminal domain-containing protein [Pseudothauera nasutitermitis]THF63867.1 cobalamin biosynthesis protein CbiX [Pseudothauera nasutitermitis]